MPWHEQHLDPEIIIFEVVLRNQRHVNLHLILRNCVYFDTVLYVVGDGNDLRMIALNVDLLDFALAEHADLHAQEVFV